jgi:ubiquinone/menaquinone biosynthesis C-methylase UbiE
MKARTRVAVVYAAVLFGAALMQAAFAQDSGPEFERQNRVADLLTLLGAKPDAVIADVGAGEGAFSIPIARTVAPNGRVVSVDISESALKKLRDRATHENLQNVETILGAVEDPHLRAGQFDAVLIHNAYHEMTEHESMLRFIRAALKPEGVFVVVEPLHDSSKGLPRDKQVANHDIEPGIVESELREAGFEIVDRDDGFVKFTGVPGAFWLVRARPK